MTIWLLWRQPGGGYKTCPPKRKQVWHQRRKLQRLFWHKRISCGIQDSSTTVSRLHTIDIFIWCVLSEARCIECLTQIIYLKIWRLPRQPAGKAYFCDLCETWNLSETASWFDDVSLRVRLGQLALAVYSRPTVLISGAFKQSAFLYQTYFV